MPFRELRRLLNGQSSLDRWRLVGVQCVFALSIVASVAFADRVLLWILGGAAPGSVSAARLIAAGAARSGQSILATPVGASLALLGGVLLSVEVLRVVTALKRSEIPRVGPPSSPLDSALDS
jgi:hypothetical protein